MAWKQSPFRLFPAEDFSARAPCPLTPAPMSDDPWTSEEQATLYGKDVGLHLSAVSDDPWPTCNDPVVAAPQPFNSFLPGSSFGQHCHSYLQSFRSDIFKAVEVIESGRLDPYLCPPEEYEEYDVDCIEPMMKLAMDEPGTHWQIPASTPATPRTPAPASTSSQTRSPSRPSFNPAPALSAPGGTSAPGSMADMGTFSSADFATDYADCQEFAELAAQAHANSMAPTANVDHMPVPGGSYSQLLAGAGCGLSCPTAPPPPPDHSRPLPHFAPRHHLPTSGPLRYLRPEPRLAESQPMQCSQRAAGPTQPARVASGTRDGRALHLSSALAFSAPLPHPAVLASNLGSCISTSSLRNYYGQSDSGRLAPPSLALKQCAGQHLQSGNCSCVECSGLLLACDMDQQLVARSEPAGACWPMEPLDMISFAAPAVPADFACSGRPAALQPLRALRTGASREPLSVPGVPAPRVPSLRVPVQRGTASPKAGPSKVSKQDLRQLFQYPIEEARKIIGLPKNAFKRIMSECGYKRWPQRQLGGLQKLMDHVNADLSLTTEMRWARLDRIQLNICAIMDGAASCIYDDLQKVSHVYHNRQHQVRSTHRDPDSMASDQSSDSDH